MQPFCVLAIQSTMSLVSFALIARWYLAPRLAARSREDALVPLLWINVFRYAPLALYAVGQVDPHIPRDVAAAIAYGDLISAVVALIAYRREVARTRFHRGSVAVQHRQHRRSRVRDVQGSRSRNLQVLPRMELVHPQLLCSDARRGAGDDPARSGSEIVSRTREGNLSEKKVIAVVGATGEQGGGLVRSLEIAHGNMDVVQLHSAPSRANGS
jgi:hypothetical protein